MTDATRVPTDGSVSAVKLTDQVRTGGALPTNTIADTGIRRVAGGSQVMTSGTLMVVLLDQVIPKGKTVNAISFLMGATGPSSPTHQWFCLLDQALNVLAKTADDLTTAWAANAEKSLAISGGYTPTADIVPYVGIVVAAGNSPTLRAAGATTFPIALAPAIVANTSDTGLTTPASLGGFAGSMTVLASVPYARVT